MYFFYYLPVGIDAETKRFPLATVLATALCVAVFVANQFFAAAVPFRFSTWIYFPGYSGFITSLSAAFLHYDYFHIVSNLIYLILFVPLALCVLLVVALIPDIIHHLGPVDALPSLPGADLQGH